MRRLHEYSCQIWFSIPATSLLPIEMNQWTQATDDGQEKMCQVTKWTSDEPKWILSATTTTTACLTGQMMPSQVVVKSRSARLSCIINGHQNVLMSKRKFWFRFIDNPHKPKRKKCPLVNFHMNFCWNSNPSKIESHIFSKKILQ